MAVERMHAYMQAGRQRTCSGVQSARDGPAAPSCSGKRYQMLPRRGGLDTPSPLLAPLRRATSRGRCTRRCRLLRMLRMLHLLLLVTTSEDVQVVHGTQHKQRHICRCGGGRPSLPFRGGAACGPCPGGTDTSTPLHTLCLLVRQGQARQNTGSAVDRARASSRQPSRRACWAHRRCSSRQSGRTGRRGTGSPGTTPARSQQGQFWREDPG